MGHHATPLRARDGIPVTRSRSIPWPLSRNVRLCDLRVHLSCRSDGCISTAVAYTGVPAERGAVKLKSLPSTMQSFGWLAGSAIKCDVEL